MNKEIYEKIKEFFSKDGFTSGSVNVRIKDELKTRITDEGDHINIEFEDSRPEVSIRIIDAKVNSITLGKKGGKIELDSFTSIPFLYKWLEE